jgi:hypothetical protein
MDSLQLSLSVDLLFFLILAPLGTVALITNAIIAPLLLRESITARDIWGLAASIVGTGLIVVASSQTENPALTPKAIVELLNQTHFLVYFIVTVVLIIVLLSLSKDPAYGRRYILVDLLLVAIFGLICFYLTNRRLYSVEH